MIDSVWVTGVSKDVKVSVGWYVLPGVKIVGSTDTVISAGVAPVSGKTVSGGLEKDAGSPCKSRLIWNGTDPSLDDANVKVWVVTAAAGTGTKESGNGGNKSVPGGGTNKVTGTVSGGKFPSNETVTVPI